MATAEHPAVSMREIDALLADAVRRVAATDPDPADPFRGLYVSDAAAVQAAGEIDGSGLDARLADVAALLELDWFDTALLAACAGPAVDARYGRLVGYLHDDLTRRLVSPRLLGALLDPPGERVLVRLQADAPLRRTGAVRLLDEDVPTAPADRGLLVDEQVVALLTGGELAAVRPSEVRIVADAPPGPARPATIARLARAAALDGSGTGVVLCIGRDAEEALACALGGGLVVLDAAWLQDPEVLRQARLHAILSSRPLAIGGLDDVPAADAAAVSRALESAARRDPPLLVCARTGAPALAGIAHVVIPVPPLTVAERSELWAFHAPGDAAALGEEFVLGSGQIALAAGIAVAEGELEGRAEPSSEDLRAAARRVSRRGLDQHGALLPARYGWADLVLPEAELAVLRSISAHVRHRGTVLDDWAFGRTVAPAPGLKLLFAGPPGTGKTLAAQIVAQDLGLEIYRIDLARVVSKFIGETEKNLGRLFDDAEDANAVLLFDEADALFGKRSAVTDAHDRYANLEVAYLLQRIEEFAGIVILSTNLRQNLDEAFLRRLDFAIDFPTPDRATRERLWRSHLPPEAPLDADVSLEALAEHGLSGGSIRNCALAAAFAAADDGGSIGQSHLERAIRLEHRKLGRLAVPEGGRPA